ncbi:major capsid protein [Gordonia phage VanLee]|uniref:Major capsid protein n=1 Tax=Gordonia phage VanLee TaxID=2845816 RepID=A0A8F2IFD6_9CAUD|nr:major capsid protein [Gordonia phage VanLee]QWS68126.1 major capsid protein [Gordonia phage VanLee]
MANDFLTPDVIARQALATLYENLVMLPLVHTDHSQEFNGPRAQGDTVRIRKPAVLNASLFNRTNGIQIQDVDEDFVNVSMDKIADTSVAVNSEELRLDIQSFDDQIMSPALEGMAQFIDRQILSLKSDVTQVAGITPAGRGWDQPEVLIEAGRLLDIRKVPPTLRHAVTGPSTRAEWLDSDIIKHADKSGSTEALRAGSIGRNLFGFDAFMTQNVPQPAGSPATGQPTTEVGVAFHQSAFAFVSAAMEIPPGAEGAVQSYNGISIRVVRQYDINKKRTVVSFDVLFGIKTIDANRAVLLKGANAA